LSLAAIAQAQLDAYNAQDVDALCRYFADDMAVADLNAAPNLHGVVAFRERHVGLFAQFPQNRAELVARVEIGNRVIDHERVFRSPDATPFEVAAIYTFAGDKIARVDFVKA